MPQLYTSSTIYIIIAVVGALVLVILLTIIIIVVLIFLHKRNAAKNFNLVTTNRKDSLDNTDEPLYQDIYMTKPPTPPLPVHFPSLNSNPEIEAYAVVNSMNDGFETKGMMNQLCSLSPPPPVVHQEVTLIQTGSDVMTQNSAYGQSSTVNDVNQEYENIATDFRTLDDNVMTQNSASADSKVPDVMTQNSAYGQSSTVNDVNQEYENIATDFRTLDDNVMTQNSASADSKVPDVMTQNSAYTTSASADATDSKLSTHLL